MKRVISILLTILMVVSLLPMSVFASVLDDATLIYDYDGLYSIRMNPDKNYKLAKDIDLLGLSAWLPVGRSNHNTESLYTSDWTFTGTLDGNGYKITNIGAVNEDYGVWYGIIAKNAGTIKNIIVDGASFRVKEYAAVIAGENTASGTIENCHIYNVDISTVQGSSTNGTAAGIVSKNSGKVINCSAVNVNLYSNDLVTAAASYLGGIASVNLSGGQISGCMAMNIHLNTKGIYTDNAGEYYGGIAGYNFSGATISNSYTRNVEAKGNQSMGGIVGTNAGTISNVFVVGTLNFHAKANKFFRAISGSIISSTSSITNAYYESGLYEDANATGSKSTANLKSGNISTALSANFADRFVAQSGHYPRLDWEEDYENYTVRFFGNDNTTVIKEYVTDIKGDVISGPEFPAEIDGKILMGWSSDEFRTGIYRSLDIYLKYGEETGDGTASKPYHIYTPAQLATISGSDKAYVICNDLYLDEFNGGTWTQIVNITGTLDGGHYNIYGLNIDNTEERCGLIQTLSSGGTIKNVNIVFGFAKSTGSYSAILCGVNFGTIERCTVSGRIEGGQNTAALVGQNSSVINQCGADKVYVSGATIVGGLSGRSSGTITESYANADIDNTASYTGGLSGYVTKGTIKNCYSLGRIDGNKYMGGLLGYTASDLTISNCYTHAIVRTSLTSSSEIRSGYVHPFAGSRSYNTSGRLTLAYQSGLLYRTTSTTGEYIAATTWDSTKYSSNSCNSIYMSATQLKTQTTYTSGGVNSSTAWSGFTSVWQFRFGTYQSSSNPGCYPTLKWQSEKYVDVTIVDGVTGEVIDSAKVVVGSTLDNANFVRYIWDKVPAKHDKDGKHYKFARTFTLDGSEITLATKKFYSNATVVAEFSNYWLVTFLNADGANPSTNVVEVDDGETVSVPASMDTTAPDGKEFLGWFAGETEYQFNNAVTKDLLIEAKYGTTSFEVKFYGAQSLDKDGEFDYELISSIEVAYAQGVNTPEIGEFVPENYEFAGWGNSSFASVTENMSVYARYNKLTQEADVLFYAHFEDGKKTDELLGKVTVEVGNTLSKADFVKTKNYTGYTFNAWSKDSITVTEKDGNYIIYANYTRNKYTVTFVDEVGSVIASNEYEHGSYILNAPTAPEKQNYKFDGWFDENTRIDLATYTVTKSVTLKANYIQSDNLPTFVLYDEYIGEAIGAWVIDKDKSPNDNSNVVVPSNDEMKHDGYTFLGWFDKNGNRFNFNEVLENGYGVAYAKYEVVKAHSLTAPTQTISATANLNDAIAQANAVAGTNRIEISLTADAQITGMVDLTRANVTINGNGHKVTGASTTSASGGLRIKADGLMLKDITWDTSSNKAWAMRVLGSFTVYFDGTVNVKAASGYAGIHVTQDTANADVTATFIGISNDAVLNITGGQSAAAIGSSNAQNSKSGKIVLRAGTFNLTGGANAAAIGGAARGSAGEVVIRGNYVVEGSTEAIKLVVNANGGKYGAAIGTGYLYSEKNKTFGKLTISDGAVVNAKAGQTGAAFGSGKRTYDPKGEKATISGEETQVNFMSSTTSGYKDGIVEFRGGSFYSQTTLNQGMTISGNHEKVLKLSAAGSSLKAQNVVMYENAYMEYMRDESLSNVTITFASSSVKNSIALKSTNSSMNFMVQKGNSAVSRVLTLSDELVQAGYNLTYGKNFVRVAK